MLGGRSGYFLFLLVGGGEGGVQGAGGGDFLMENPRKEGGGFSRVGAGGRGAGRVFAGNLGGGV